MIEHSLTFTPRTDRVTVAGKSAVNLTITWSGNRVRASIGLKVKASAWNQEIQRVTKAHEKYREINRALTVYIDNFGEWFDDLATSPTPEMVVAKLDQIRTEHFKKKSKIVVPAVEVPKQITLAEFPAEYIKQRRSDRSPSWCSTVKAVANHITAFRQNLTWLDLNLNTLNQFKAYLQEEEELSDNTLETYVGILRGMLKYSTRYQVPVPPDFNWLETRSAGDVVRPILSHQNIASIREASLQQIKEQAYGTSLLKTEALESTRWYFMMACGTGLRYSDLWQLITPKINTIDGINCLEVLQQKTKRRVQVPMSDDTYYLLKNPVSKEKPVDLYNYNQILKPIGQAARLEDPVVVGSYYNGQFISDTVPLYDTLSSHMARRSFATLMTQGGCPTRILQEIMGHKSINATEKYAQLSDSTVAHQAVAAWGKSQKVRS